MKMSKLMKICFVYMMCVIPICLLLINIGKATITYSGFGVDSAGILYIGKDDVIEKYENNKLLGTISPQTSRGYAFTLQEDDTILLSTASNVYKLDLAGKVLDKWEDEGTSTFNKLQYIRKFKAKDGREYLMKLQLGRTVICSGDDVIYKMPMLDYIVRILWWSNFVALLVFFITFIVKLFKKPEDVFSMLNTKTSQPIIEEQE